MSNTMGKRVLALVTILFAGAYLGELHAQERDSGGRIMQFSEWNTVDRYSIIVNISELKNIEINSAKQRIRDNSVFHQIVQFDGGKGRMFIGHYHGGRYNNQTTNIMKDVGELNKSIDSFSENMSLDFELVSRRKIQQWGERGGWIVSVKDDSLSMNCIFAQMGYMSDLAKQSSGEEYYDTYVYFNDCSSNRSLDEVERFLLSMRVKG